MKIRGLCKGGLNFLARQFYELKKGGIKTFFQKVKALVQLLKYFLKRVAKLLLIFPLLIIYPWIHIRIGRLITHRIGHLSLNSELYLCEKKWKINYNKGILFSIDLHFLGLKPYCNQKLIELLRPNFNILPKSILEPIYNAAISMDIGKKFIVGDNTQQDRDVFNLLDITPHFFKIPDEEIKYCESMKRKLGIPNGMKHICLNVRDDAYLKSQLNGNYEYHNFRDSDIKDFISASEYLANRGYAVVRMGAVVNQKLESMHPYIIDYANSGMRDEMLDLYLSSTCLFSLATGTGLDGVTLAFRRPLALASFAPIGYMPTFCQSNLLLAKHYVCENSGVKLNYHQIVDQDLDLILDANEFKRRGVALVSNTPEEILELSIEMLARVEGRWLESTEDLQLQDNFWKVFRENSIKKNKHIFLHGDLRAKYSAHFLRNNQDWFN